MADDPDSELSRHYENWNLTELVGLNYCVLQYNQAMPPPFFFLDARTSILSYDQEAEILRKKIVSKFAGKCVPP